MRGWLREPDGWRAQAHRRPAGLLGRRRELDELVGLLTRHRLVTVAGAAGVGKSRLAAEAVSRLTDHLDPTGPEAGHPGSDEPPTELFPDGVLRLRCWTEGPQQDPDTRAATDTETLTALTAIADTTATRGRIHGGHRLLVLLDDIDPVRGACIAAVRALLQRAPHVRVLLTARQPLGLGDEQVLRLAPLALVPPGTPGISPAAELLLQKAHAARPRLDFSGDDLEAANDICATLEGIPLALELAAAQAARVPLGTLAQMVTLSQGWLGADDTTLWRHRSLRAAVGAGFALHERVDRIVWSRLSVFPGAFDLAAATQVCAGGVVRPDQVAPAVARLAMGAVLDVVRDPGGVRPGRYRLTRAARDFGVERLQAAGETATAQDLHLKHCRRVATQAEQAWGNGRQTQAAQLLREEADSLHAALLRTPADQEQTLLALDSVVDLWFWWAVCGHADRGLAAVRHLLRHCPQDHPVRARALWLAAWLAVHTRDGAARELLEEAWRAAVLTGDGITFSRIVHVQGLLALFEGNDEAAIGCFAEAADSTPTDADYGPSAAISSAGLAVAQVRTRPRAALRSARRALSHPQLRHDAWAQAMAQYACAVVDHDAGRRSRAWRRAHRALQLIEGLAGPRRIEVVRRLIAHIESGTPHRVCTCSRATA